MPTARRAKRPFKLHAFALMLVSTGLAAQTATCDNSTIYLSQGNPGAVTELQTSPGTLPVSFTTAGASATRTYNALGRDPLTGNLYGTTANGNVLVLDSGPLLLIPMRVSGRLVGVQTITTDGEKKFLFGQQCSGAEYVIDNKGRDFFCEGYATGLSVRAALSALKMRYRVHVCFSAHNLTKLAGACPGGLVIADNDSSGAGLRAAQQSGLKFFIPPTVGHDFNDMHKSLGVFKLSQMIRQFMMDTS